MERRPKKRGRASSQRLTAEPALKRKPVSPEEDDDILSEDVDGETALRDDDIPTPPSPKSDAQSSEPENETAEQRRLRLARAYLKHIGVSEDPVEGTDEEASEEEGANQLLREKALTDTGVTVTKLADKISSCLPSATITRCKSHALPPTCIALSYDGETTAVSGGKDSRLIVWDVETHRRKFMFKPTIEKTKCRNPYKSDGHIGHILSVAVTDDARLAASGGADGLVRVWDLRAGKLIDSLRGHRGSINGLAFQPGTQQLFSGAQDRTVKRWDLREMAYAETLFGHGGEVNAVSCLVAERALSCGRDGTLRLYKVAEGSQLVFRRSQTMSVDTVSMINKERFVSGGDDGSLCLWYRNKKKPTAVVENAHGNGLGCENWISSVTAFRSTDMVMSGGGDGLLRFWKCEDVPKLIPVGAVDLGPGFLNGIAVGKRHDLIAVAVGMEHRLGRWSRIPKAKNTIQFVSLQSVD